MVEGKWGRVRKEQLLGLTSDMKLIYIQLVPRGDTNVPPSTGAPFQPGNRFVSTATK